METDYTSQLPMTKVCREVDLSEFRVIPDRFRVASRQGAVTLGGMSDITQILNAAAAGDRKAAADLLPLVYDELRKLAAAKISAETPGHTLDPTALVHEAYLRLIGYQQFDGSAHFFAVAAESMRRVLIDHARSRRAGKRSAGGRTTLDPDWLPADQFDPDRWLDLDAALTRLEAVDPTAGTLAKLRLFGGLSVEEAGEVVGMPRATAFRTWTYARAWLTARLSENAKAESPNSADS